MELTSVNLRKRYGRREVVRSISLTVRSGEIVGLLGPNGAGKTTTFYSLVGFIRPDGGEILLDRQPITKLPMYLRSRNGIGYLAQEPSIFRGLTVEENLLAVLERSSGSASENRRKAERMLQEFGLHALRAQKATHLSGGEKRRLEVARALLTDPGLILLDEPFIGIDPITVSDLKRMIRGLKERNLGILITDHNVRDTLSTIDRGYLLLEGSIVLEGTSEELQKDPRARRFYLGEDFRM
ncbi:MAG: LPS export ABC transporter ATP-binding protein [Elusimicrobia bacterium]|nr:LPS export ABC transporter ATP-binding protein [Elusimicrobiota bacterium]